MKSTRKNARFRHSHLWQPDVLEQRRLLSAAISFANHTEFIAGNSPDAIVSADFNNDGNLDLAVANAVADQVSIFFGNGDGTFTPGPIVPVSGSPTALVALDFNGTGFNSLAVGLAPGSLNTGTAVSIFRNNGGQFELTQTATVFTGAAANEPIELTSGFFNNDTFLDLAATDFSGNSVSILLGVGNGTFQNPVPYPVDNNPTSIVAGDFNGDGKLDLAVADTDTITNNNMTTSSLNVVTFLSGNGDGTFTVAARSQLTTTGADVLAVADMNNDSQPDLIAASADSSAEVLINNGKFQFTESALFALAGPGSSIAAADFNFDGDTDLIFTNGSTTPTNANEVSIATGAGDGTFSTFSDAATGQEPVAVAVGDFNNDGKPDLAIADQAGGQVSILLNNTSGTAIKATTTFVQPLGDSATPFGQSIQFSAQVITAGTGADTGIPDGNVEFFDGTHLLGTSPLNDAGIAVFSSTSLNVGNHQIYAQYLGDSTFARSTSNTFVQTITPTAGHGPDLVGTFITSTLPSVIIPGEKIGVKIKITNQGNTSTQGTITDDFFLSLDNTLDSSDILVSLTGPLAQPKIKLQPNQSIVLSGSLIIPTDAPNGNYILLANLNDTQTLLESDYSNNVVISPSTIADLNEFGSLGGHQSAVLTLPDADGTAVTYKLSGPGTGTVNVGDDGIDVTLNNTTQATTVTITAKGGNGRADINSISATSVVGAIKAPLADVDGFVTLSGGVGTLVLGNLMASGGDAIIFSSNSNPDGQLTIGAGPASSITLGSILPVPQGDSNSGLPPIVVGSFQLASASPIRSLSMTTWSAGGDISAPSIGTLISKEDFSAILTGATGVGKMALHSASIGGAVAGNWQLTGNVAKISIGSDINVWTAGIDGQLQSFIDNGDFNNGTIAAASFGSVAIRGNMGASKILAGSNLTTFSVGTIRTLHIGGLMTRSVIAAGLADADPAGIPPPAGDQLLDGGEINSISINGSIDDVSRILAESLPTKIKIGGTTLTPATDPHFHL